MDERPWFVCVEREGEERGEVARPGVGLVLKVVVVAVAVAEAVGMGLAVVDAVREGDRGRWWEWVMGAVFMGFCWVVVWAVFWARSVVAVRRIYRLTGVGVIAALGAMAVGIVAEELSEQFMVDAQAGVGAVVVLGFYAWVLGRRVRELGWGEGEVRG